MEKIAAFFMSLVMLLSGAAPGSTPERAENFRVVSYLFTGKDGTLYATLFGGLLNERPAVAAIEAAADGRLYVK